MTSWLEWARMKLTPFDLQATPLQFRRLERPIMSLSHQNERANQTKITKYMTYLWPIHVINQLIEHNK